MEIIAYYTIALKTIVLGEDISNTLLKRIDGFSSDNNIQPTYLIGQLGRSDQFRYKDLSGTDILDFALSSINNAKDIVGGRIVLLECENVPYLISLYESMRFKFLQPNPDNPDLLQYISFLAS